jgi:acetyl esterase/lipase
VNAGGVSSLALGTGTGERPAILYLHGGGYTVGSAYGYRPLVGALVAAADVAALVPDYRLAPEHPFPAAVEDALSAYRWLTEQSGPGIVLAGDSAGAGLVCSLLVTLRQHELPAPAGAVLLCPAVDLTDASPLASGPPETVSAMRITRDAYLGGHSADDPVLSPLSADLTGLPPLLIQTATGDLALGEAQQLAEHASQCGVDARIEVYPADTHVFQVFWSFLPEAADALQQAGAFTREMLQRSGSSRSAAD